MKTIQEGLTNLCKTTPKSEIKKIQESTPIDWMNDGRSNLFQVYDFKKDIISKEYDENSSKIIEKQIFNSGVRIAGLLTNVFKN